MGAFCPLFLLTVVASYSTCNFFQTNVPLSAGNFEVSQNEIMFDSLAARNVPQFKAEEIIYHCHWAPSTDINNKLPALIIPVRDMSVLLRFTLGNLKEKGIPSQVNIIVVDDRSVEDIKGIATEFNCSYLRIDNSKGFNFSMLNNIPAFLFHKLGGSHCILWNSDLWVDDASSFKIFVERHIESCSKISGSKLLYPVSNFYPFQTAADEINFEKYYANSYPHLKNGKWRGRVQFGGSIWVDTSKTSPIKTSPDHFGRFSLSHSPEVNCEKLVTFVTGALMMVDLKWFIRIGGLNPSLGKGFQDVDLGLRAYVAGEKIMYFGKDISFVHGESFSFYALGTKKIDKQIESDHYLFSQLWNQKVNLLKK